MKKSEKISGSFLLLAVAVMAVAYWHLDLSAAPWYFQVGAWIGALGAAGTAADKEIKRQATAAVLDHISEKRG